MGSEVETVNVSVDVGCTVYQVLLSDLSAFMMYSIRVRAATGAGFGPFTPPIIRSTLEAGECVRVCLCMYARVFVCNCVHVDECTCTFSSLSLPRPAPSPPVSVNITVVNSTSLLVSWGVPKFRRGEIEFYQVEYSSPCSSTVGMNTTDNSTEALLSGLSPFTEYAVRVRAFTVEFGDFSTNQTRTTAEDGRSWLDSLCNSYLV